jgi:hypothetical protein
MAVSDARNADDRVAIGVSNLRSLRRPLRTAPYLLATRTAARFPSRYRDLAPRRAQMNMAI